MEVNDNSPEARGSQVQVPQDRDGLPPFVNSWKQLYILLIGTLLLLIVLFYSFMIHFQ
jgi:uncharacterized protein YpmS